MAKEVIRLSQPPVRIPIKYFDHDGYKVQAIEKLVNGDWIDLRSAVDVTLRVFDYFLIPLGVGMILPSDMEAHVVPRSSTYKNFGIILANGVGIIDNSYNGDADEWKFPAIALRPTEIHKGDRICQFRITERMAPICFETVEFLNEISRGGIGSTGVN